MLKQGRNLFNKVHILIERDEMIVEDSKADEGFFKILPNGELTILSPANINDEILGATYEVSSLTGAGLTKKQCLSFLTIIQRVESQKKEALAMITSIVSNPAQVPVLGIQNQLISLESFLGKNAEEDLTEVVKRCAEFQSMRGLPVKKIILAINIAKKNYCKNCFYLLNYLIEY